MAGKRDRAKKAAEADALITPPGSAEKAKGKDRTDELSGSMQVDGEEAEGRGKSKVYLPGMALAEDEELKVDPSAYVMLHQMNAEWPCLSFDIVRDGGAEERTAFPMSGYLITGSQADTHERNLLYLLRYSNLHKTLQNKRGKDDEDDDEDENEDKDSSSHDESSSEEEEEEEEGVALGRKQPRHHCITIPHEGGVNRVRSINVVNEGVLQRVLTATWADTGRVYIWDLQPAFVELAGFGLQDPSSLRREPLKPIHVVNKHRSEGFALSWSPLAPGRLLAGDCDGAISLTEVLPARVQTGEFFQSHQGSVEDLHWSPSESTVFASASTDGTVRLWDIRMPRNQAALAARVSTSDVNVISWNRLSNHMLASGADDGVFATWDLRTWPASSGGGVAAEAASATPLYTSDWHRGAITSVEWSPHDASVLAVAGADDQVTIWDFALEQPESEGAAAVVEAGSDRAVPFNLLFIHQGQKEVKEIHWHPQLSGVLVTTALSGFNIFKTISV